MRLERVRISHIVSMCEINSSVALIYAKGSNSSREYVNRATCNYMQLILRNL